MYLAFGAWGAAGSSPRTRGTAVVFFDGIGNLRFIPAHAGNSGQQPLTMAAPAVHPRARGEQAQFTAHEFPSAGSSPRTRGTDDQGRHQGGQVRFIPAHAGNRCSWSPGAATWPVHPRARGEQSRYQYATALRAGSSPRTRGTVALGLAGGRDDRFIPAHAGNRAGCLVNLPLLSVHPRARGEQRAADQACINATGSSPRTRGTVAQQRNPVVIARFIPAHAGNRASAGRCSEPRPVHPRARGEQCIDWSVPCPSIGSSPRTRGTEGQHQRALGSRRFIPAHAGNSCLTTHLRRMCPVHPRARGEQLGLSSVIWEPHGSSPRTRGTGSQVRGADHQRRFIPAHAGNSLQGRSDSPECAVHPRARGEQDNLRFDALIRDGSSSRTRGTVLPIRIKQAD